jgi:hypothetical protein
MVIGRAWRARHRTVGAGRNSVSRFGALLRAPRLLLLDEPMSQLDAGAAVEVGDDLRVEGNDDGRRREPRRPPTLAADCGAVVADRELTLCLITSRLPGRPSACPGE